MWAFIGPVLAIIQGTVAVLPTNLMLPCSFWGQLVRGYTAAPHVISGHCYVPP